MKLMSVLIIVTLALSVYSQRIRNIECGCVSDTVKYYYKTVFQAENYLVQGKVDSSLFYYTDARILMQMMQIDKANISRMLGVSLQDESKMYFYLNSFKVLPDSITKEKYLENLKNYISIELIARLDTQLQEVMKISRKFNPNNSLISEKLEQLEYEDQHGEPIWVDGYFKLGKSNRRKKDRARFFSIIDLYKRFGSINFAAFNGQEPGDFSILLLHNFYDTRLQKRYNHFFENEVKCGNIDPRTYAMIVDNYLFDSTQVYGFHTIFFVADTLIVYKLSDDGQKRINENRGRIFLQDIETTQKKLIWQWQHSNEFIFSAITEITPYEPSQTAKSLAEDHLRRMGALVDGYTFFTR